jgi:sigma-E factor negative regulatory protein RseA
MLVRISADGRDLRRVAMAMDAFDESAKERLSALADAELDGHERDAAYADWAASAVARQDWHAWHLIGDVLRSEDLASDPRRDRQLCAAIRSRLQQEPVVLAPRPLAARRRAGWSVGAAVAAGFVLVVGTFAVFRPTDSPAPAVIARNEHAPVATVAPVATPVAVSVPSPAAPTEAVVADIRLIRDAQLDRYLAAHKQFAGSSALGVPSAFLRSATVDTAPR